MALPSFLKRKDKAAPPENTPSEDGADVQAARTRARQRLIGATVLLAIGIVGFPMLFETQPRPVPLDVPVELGRKGSVAAPVPAPAAPMGPSAQAPVVPRAAPAPQEVIVETEEAPRPAATERAAAAEAPPSASRPSSTATAALPRPAPGASAPRPAETVRAADDGARARALLEGKPVATVDRPDAAPKPDAAASGERFVVQVGAYADAAKLREARQKVEKLGLKTYTQEVETEAGKRTRVRIGPFTSRQEAEAAQAKLRSAGLQPALLTL